ncbi:transcriptional regulator with XRE-family HTH domain [Kitasatospora sp. MAA4]|uniref:helix-turn-helix domain-containing protein n=1 Tax=Kitasatospora sp. MAA4 TaxID=3035093 RepID=UPI00247354F3|nr:helix-turn-helix transcriptional regulator [Kitasatospora sp. MAA4]MDH6137420.1 transcriptional regulator with XRE-family HTH domain [Kitasatospora sp. MAA4]
MGFKPNDLYPERSNRDLYGYEIRSRRYRANMSLTRLADILKFSKSHLARIETAESLPPPGLSEALDAAFGTDGIFVRLYPLARREEFPDRYRRFMDLAAKAAVHESFTLAVPGLLQTADYARVALRSGNPHEAEQETDDKVRARLNRQARIHGPSPARYWFVLDESALRRPVGDAKVMCDQMDSLLRNMSRSHVTVQILPFSSGVHAEMGGSLTLLTSPERTVVAYLEGSRSGQLEEDPGTVIAYQESYDLLRAQALSPKASAAMIRAAMEEYERDATRLTARPVAEE